VLRYPALASVSTPGDSLSYGVETGTIAML
jgi:hypothetical protein